MLCDLVPGGVAKEITAAHAARSLESPTAGPSTTSRALSGQGSPLRWMVLDGTAIGDVDYTALAVLARGIEHLRKRHIRIAFSAVSGCGVRHPSRPPRLRAARVLGSRDPVGRPMVNVRHAR